MLNFTAHANEVISVTTISMLELRKNSEAVILRLQAGERFELTYRGILVGRLEPVESRPFTADDPFFSLIGLCDAEPDSLTNTEMDRLIYGE